MLIATVTVCIASSTGTANLSKRFCAPTAFLGPWHLNLFDTMLRTVDSRDTGVQESLELTAVRVSPLSLRSILVAEQRQ